MYVGSITLASHGLEEPAHALSGLEDPFFQLCCCVSFWFWREIGFGCTYYYVLGVPYSCGVVLFFLVLVGNCFWCYVRTSVQYSCAVVSVFLLWWESFITTGKKVLVVCLAGCAVVSVFGSSGK